MMIDDLGKLRPDISLIWLAEVFQSELCISVTKGLWKMASSHVPFFRIVLGTD